MYVVDVVGFKLQSKFKLGAIFISRKDLGVGGWVVQKMLIFPYFMWWKFPHIGGWVVQKSLKTPLRNKDGPIYCVSHKIQA